MLKFPIAGVLLFLTLSMTSWATTTPSWGPTTSGPFFTGTAETDPAGSFFFETYAYDYLQPRQHTQSLNLPQRFSVGLGDEWEFDTDVNLIVNGGTVPSGQSVIATGVGNTTYWIKKQMMADEDPTRFWASPALSFEVILAIPSGKYLNLNPQLYGLDQMGTGTYQESLQLVARKRFKPFDIYLQIGDAVQNPTSVEAGYAYNNGLAQTGGPSRVVYGNLLNYQAAFEHVLDDQTGAGYLVEITGASQSGYNFPFGRSNAPTWSFLWGGPEVEITYPNTRSLQVTWGAGIMLPIYQSDYSKTVIPMFTVTLYGNGPMGHRGE